MRWRGRLALALFAFAGWLVASPLCAQPVVAVTGQQASVPLVPRTVLFDRDGALSPVEALQRLSRSDAEVETKAYSHGYIPDIMWSRIVLDIEPKAAGRWYLSLELPNFDRLQVFTVPADGGAPVPLVALGDHVPRVTDIRSRFHIAPVDLVPGRLVLLVRGQTGSTMTLDLKLRKLDQLLAEEQDFFALQAFYLGISAVLGLSALGLFLYTRQIIYLVYIVNLISHNAIWLIINGIGPGHLWPGLAERFPVDNHSMVALNTFTTAAFSAMFLSTTRVPALVRQGLWVLAGIGLALTALCALVPDSERYWTSTLVSDLILPAAGFLIIVTAVGLFRGEPAARPLMLTWIGAIAAVGLALLRDLGIVPNNVFTLNGAQLGSVVEMIIFAYMLLDRLGRFQKERDQLQREALAAAREYEAELEQRVADRTAELDAAVERERGARRLQQQFVAMVSHEFRTPLAIVDATAQNIATTKPDDQSRLEKIRVAVRRLRRMIDTCLIDERVESGRIHLQPEVVELCGLMEDSVEMLQAAAVDHKFDLELPDDPVVVRADPRLAEIAVNNLLENAVKYSPAGSTVTVTVAATEDGAEITVTDQGAGVPEADRQRIFEKYYRAGTSVGTSGSGLGLHLVRSILDAHGGSVSYAVGPQGGSRFVIRLPASAGAEIAA